MAGPAKARKRVEAEDGASVASLVRARDGSAFARCDECNKDVPVALIGMHSCSLDAKIKMNLESQVVENPPEVKKTKKNAADSGESGEPKAKRSKKASKDPNRPKRPPTAYFIFMADFRKTYKESNPDSKEPKQVVKDAGEKWTSMTEDEKKPYVEKAAQLKADFAKTSGGSDVNNCGDDDNAAEATKDEAEELTEEGAEESTKDEAGESTKEEAEESN